jgi:LuxR family transcriptional regulator, maltose regulon positive regulatory protein
MTILLTKVRPPQRRKDILRRMRLVDVLHQNLHRKLTFVSAPAGYGKTTLLIDFASDVDAIVCWYRIAPDDSDLLQFVRHVVAAFQQKFPEFGKDLSKQLENPAGSSDPPSLAAELINEVQRSVQDFTLLILDDYHLAGENQQIVNFIERLLEHLPDHLRVLMGSRSVYGIPTANLYIRDELITISADELRFRADELQKLVLRNYRMRLSDEQANEFANRADGWIIAILLAIRTMEGGILPKFSGAIEQIYDYLAEEVISRQTEDLRAFMLGTSILSDFNEELCNTLLERTDSGALLRSLEERNLFVSRTETLDGNSYRYHQLFAEFLQSYFERHDPKRKQGLHQRAAEWHRSREEWESAIAHKLAAGEKETAAEWMDAVAGQYYAFDRQLLLARWLAELERPPDFRRHAPHLLLYQAKALGNQNKFDACLSLLDMAEPKLKRLVDTEALANAITTRGMVYRYNGSYKKALGLAEKAQILLSKDLNNFSAQRQWHQAERLKGIPAFFTGEKEQAARYLTNAADGLRSLTNFDAKSASIYQYDLAECLNDLGLVHISSGNILEAQKAFQETLQIHLSIRSNQGALASARNNIGYLHHQVGHYAQAWSEYGLALESAKEADRVFVQVGILNGRGELLFDLEEIIEAKAQFEQAVKLASQHGETSASAISYLGLARVERVSKNYSDAMAWLRKAASCQAGPLDTNEYATELGRIYRDMGQDDLALEQFEVAFNSVNDWQAPKQCQVLAAFFAGYLHFKMQDVNVATALLEKSLHGAAQLGYDQFLVVAAQQSKEYLNAIGTISPSVQLESFILKVHEFIPSLDILEPAPSQMDVPEIHLQVQALDDVQIRRNGELLPSTIWKSNRARALFFYILLHGKARKEAIGIDFWPDFSPGKVSSNFHATLWRVRQALGFRDAIIFEDDTYKFHPSISIWYDVAEFQNYIQQVKSEKLSKAARSELLRQAINLYQGPYLPDVYMDWADQFRDELRNTYLEALASLAALELNNKRYSESRRLYEKIVSVDPYRDEIHLELMKCLNLLGSPSAALAHFKRYKAMLRKDLNAEPLAELQEYYEQLAVKA